MDEDAVSEKNEQLARMVLNYLARNPDAGDTLEGIAKWWLDTERIESLVDEVADALVGLVEQGLVRIRESEGGRIFYANSKQNRLDHSHN
jgi:Fe2+ or Zn2+ uptake regulation protein